MTRRRAIMMVALGLGLIAAGALLLRRTGPGGPPIVLVVIDTLRADHLGTYGYFRDTSPRLDAFARESLLFERARTPIGTTLPAIVSLFSSTNPLQHGVLGNVGFYGKVVAADGPVRLMPQILGDLGYHAAGIVSSPAVAKMTGLDTGFDHYEGGDGDGVGEHTTDRALAHLDSIDTAQPFFLFIHYVDPHSPYRAPAPFKGRYASDASMRAWLKERHVWLSEGNLDVNDRYDAEVSYVDEHVGRLLDGLRQRGLFDRAAIVVTADHGEGLGQHKWLFHGRIFEEQARVPLMMRLPGRRDLDGRRSADLVSLIDILPTLVAQLRLPVAEEQRARFTGIDVLGARRDWVYAERPRLQKRSDKDKTEHYALVGPRWKFFYRPETSDRLYDLDNDPSESVNMIRKQRQLAASMRATLLELIERYRANGTPLTADAAEELDESARERLRQLGYDF